MLIRPPLIGFEISTTALEAMTVRGQRAVFTAANFAMADTWQKKYKAMHFGVAARHRYSYAQRRASTLRRKSMGAARGKVEDGGRLDLVHTGVLRRAVLRHHPIRATPKFSTIRLEGPSYFNIRYKPGRPNIADEVTRIIPSEGTVLGQAAIGAADKAIEKNRRQRRKTIK